MITAPTTTPSAQPARGGGWGGRGRPRGGGQDRYYDIPSHIEAIAFDSVITDSLSSPIYRSTLVGDSLIMDPVYQSCLITLSGFETKADLLLLSMVDFDVILGMDWLSPHYAIFDCRAKTVILAMLGLP
ncbi:uncharacterized protein [Nicotiana sylvestris]|uniref:uncharacterized protein n=1 Tax=Nicotiana sylvestris TaxID=4096 RepID=UPI00388C49DD